MESFDCFSEAGIKLLDLLNELEEKEAMWNCPLCGNKKMPYGETCKNYPDCGNELNVTGKWYFDADGNRKRKVKDVGVGISEISNEG
jgi:hypothetical protein